MRPDRRRAGLIVRNNPVEQIARMSHKARFPGVFIQQHPAPVHLVAGCRQRLAMRTMLCIPGARLFVALAVSPALSSKPAPLLSPVPAPTLCVRRRRGAAVLRHAPRAQADRVNALGNTRRKGGCDD
jgi:hypothetical protein